MTEKKPLCEFGKQIEIALIQMDKRNDWLIEQVKEDTGRYFEELNEAFDRVCDALKISDRRWTPANPMRPEVFDSPDLLEVLEDRLLQLAEENKCTRWEENHPPRQECTLCDAHQSGRGPSSSECTGSGR